jgi:ATP-binding cassette subfamily F protein uup
MSNLSAKNVTKVYGAKPVLSNVTLNLNPGDRVVLVGENGAGKTTLLRILAGVEEPSKGSVSFNSHMPRTYVAQEFDGDLTLTGAEFVGNEKAQRAAQRMLDELDMPASLLQLRMEVMSGGQKKILQLIKAIVSKVPYLLMDEPENHLDYFAREWLISTLLE